MEFIGFTYVTNFLAKPLEEAMFEVVDEANRLLADWGLGIRFLYLGSLTLEPGYLISINGSERLFPLEVLIDYLDYTLRERQIEGMNKVLGLTSFPLASRNPYLDFYESFLGFQTERLGRRIMVLSMRPFESEVMRMTVKTLEDSRASEEVKGFARRILSREIVPFKARLLKGILHELGHAFGLGHCPNPCVMNPPATIQEWDSRPAIFCRSCMRKLRGSTPEFPRNL